MNIDFSKETPPTFDEFKDIIKPVKDWYDACFPKIFAFAENPDVANLGAIAEHLLAHPGAAIYAQHLILKQAIERARNDNGG